MVEKLYHRVITGLLPRLAYFVLANLTDSIQAKSFFRCFRWWCAEYITLLTVMNLRGTVTGYWLVRKRGEVCLLQKIHSVTDGRRVIGVWPRRAEVRWLVRFGVWPTTIRGSEPK